MFRVVFIFDTFKFVVVRFELVFTKFVFVVSILEFVVKMSPRIVDNEESISVVVSKFVILVVNADTFELVVPKLVFVVAKLVVKVFTELVDAFVLTSFNKSVILFY